jgi:hypothetical protein
VALRSWVCKRDLCSRISHLRAFCHVHVTCVMCADLSWGVGARPHTFPVLGRGPVHRMASAGISLRGRAGHRTVHAGVVRSRAAAGRPVLPFSTRGGAAGARGWIRRLSHLPTSTPTTPKSVVDAGDACGAEPKRRGAGQPREDRRAAPFVIVAFRLDDDGKALPGLPSAARTVDLVDREGKRSAQRRQVRRRQGWKPEGARPRSGLDAQHESPARRETPTLWRFALRTHTKRAHVIRMQTGPRLLDQPLSKSTR